MNERIQIPQSEAERDFKSHQERAFGRFEERGRGDGKDWEDWFATELKPEAGRPENSEQIESVGFSDDEIRPFAYKIWEEKGKPHQSEEEGKNDWLAAVAMVKQSRQSTTELKTQSEELLEIVEPEYEPTDEEIGIAAYQIWEKKGSTHGHHEEDWFEARDLLKQRRKEEKIRVEQEAYELSEDEIRSLAYEIWEEKDRTHGHHEEDWFEAREALKEDKFGLKKIAA